MKKLILPATIAAIMATAPLAATADVKLSGQVNRMVANIDNGVDSELNHLDNNGSGTRFRLKGETDAGNGIMVGFYWESQYQSNPSNGADGSTVTDFNDNGIVSRQRDLYFKGGFGKVSMGQGDGAANGITEMDYTGTTYLTGYSSPNDIWGGVTFGNTTRTVGSVVNGYDGLSRNDRVRYDSPKLGPVTLSFDMGQGGKTEMAIRFATDLGDGVKVKGGFAMWDRNDAAGVGNTDEGTGGSIAVDLGGFNAAYHIGTRDQGAGNVEDENGMFVLGFKTGVHSLSLRMGTTDDRVDGVSADSMGLGYVNRSLKSTELYAGYQTFELDDAANPTAEDIAILFAGARVKF